MPKLRSVVAKKIDERHAMREPMHAAVDEQPDAIVAAVGVTVRHPAHRILLTASVAARHPTYTEHPPGEVAERLKAPAC